MKLPAAKEREKSTVEQLTYTLASGTRVEITVRAFETKNRESTAERKESDKRSATIFLTGWSMGADTRSGQLLGAAFAEGAEFVEGSKKDTYTLSTRTERKGNKEANSLYEEAQAIAQCIKDKGIDDVTLVGHSQGGDKAIHVASILQKDPEIQIKGLMLMNAMGLYEQTPSGLIAGFAQDSLANTPLTLAKEIVHSPGSTKRLIKKAMESGTIALMDILSGIVGEISKSGLAYPGNFLTTVKEMAAVNPRLAELHIPIIVCCAAEDPISDPKKILSSAKEDEDFKTREELLRKYFFPNSPYVRMIIPKKSGNHGLPLYRPELAARALLELLERFYREEKKPKTR